MYKYTDSTTRITDCMYDFAYGIYPVRNMSFFKNKLHQLKKIMLNNKDEFESVIKEVIEWSPNNFTWEQRLIYFRSHNFEISEANLELYRQLMEIDIENWWSGKFRVNFEKESGKDIFFKIVKQASKYICCKEMIQEYSSNHIPANIPSVVTRKIDSELSAAHIENEPNQESNDDSDNPNADADYKSEEINDLDFNETHYSQPSEDLFDQENFYASKYMNKTIYQIKKPKKLDPDVNYESGKVFSFNFTYNADITFKRPCIRINSSSSKMKLDNCLNGSVETKNLESHAKECSIERDQQLETFERSFDNMKEDYGFFDDIDYNENKNFQEYQNEQSEYENEKHLELSNIISTLCLPAPKQIFKLECLYKSLLFLPAPSNIINSWKDLQQQENEKLLENRFEIYREKAMNALRYRRFTTSDLKHACFCNKYRPVEDEWSQFISYLLVNNFISDDTTFENKNSKIKRYRFNLQVSTGRGFLTTSYIFEKIRKAALINADGKFHAYLIKKRICYVYRPSLLELKMYLEDLAKDSILQETQVQDSKKLYILFK